MSFKIHEYLCDRFFNLNENMKNNSCFFAKSAKLKNLNVEHKLLAGNYVGTI